MLYCWYACKHHTSLNVHDCFHTRVVCPLLGKASPPKERPKTSLGGRLQVTSENETQNKTKQSIILLGRFFAETVLFSAAIAAIAASTRLRLIFIFKSGFFGVSPPPRVGVQRSPSSTGRKWLRTSSHVAALSSKFCRILQTNPTYLRGKDLKRCTLANPKLLLHSLGLRLNYRIVLDATSKLWRFWTQYANDLELYESFFYWDDLVYLCSVLET